jgi:hypothetical protein
LLQSLELRLARSGKVGGYVGICNNVWEALWSGTSTIEGARRVRGSIDERSFDGADDEVVVL